MNKFFLSTIIITILLSTGILTAQYDARRLPDYLDAQKANEPRSLSRKMKVFYHDYSPEAMKKKTGSNTLLTDNGVKIINVTMGNNNQSETWITINPTNPLNIVAGANDYRYYDANTGYRMGAYYSFDGGKTWGESATPDVNNAPLVI
ncbi:MAG: hypothetical protein ABSG15_15210, partial [FCB group bacterium]